MSKIGKSEVTPIKQKQFAEILGLHMKIVSKIFKKHQNVDWLDGRYLYIDLNSGDGGNGDATSPIIFLDIVHRLNIPYQAYFIDIDSHNCENLDRKIYDTYGCCDSIEIINMDNSQFLSESYGWDSTKLQYGIMYSDSNGCPNWTSLKDFYKNNKPFSKTDLLINYPASAQKRSLKSPIAFEDKRVIEHILEVNKTHWMCRVPIGKFQWSFLIGTNWNNFPEFEQLGCYKATSNEGRAILDRLSYTTSELTEGIHRLPFLFNYKSYLMHPHFKMIVSECRGRAGNKCERCNPKYQGYTEPHHLKYPPWPEFDKSENILMVCRKCHCELEGKET